MLRRMFIAIGVMLGLAATLAAPALAQNTTGLVLTTCGSPVVAFKANNPGPFTVNAAGQLCITGSISASLGGFNAETFLTPFTATTGGVASGSFTAGKTIVVSNAGTTNTAYCKLGAASTTSGQPILPGIWFAFTSIAETQVTCATSTSTTTVNVAVGTGLPTGAGGGGGSGGGGGAVFGPTANGAAAANPPVLIGGTANGTATGNVGNWKVDSAGTGVIDCVVGGTLCTAINSPIPAGTNTIGTTGSLPYPVGATPITASNTGTTAATTATLAGAVGKTTYICGYSIRANATAATTVTNTITGVITATLSSIMWIAPAASGLGIDEQIFSPCIPASGTNQAIAIVSGAPGTGGLVSSKGWGYQL